MILASTLQLYSYELVNIGAWGAWWQNIIIFMVRWQNEKRIISFFFKIEDLQDSCTFLSLEPLHPTYLLPIYNRTYLQTNDV